MTPYASYFYFGVVAAVTALPLAWMSLRRGSARWWVPAVTLIMLVIQYGGELPTRNARFSELDWLLLYGGCEWLVAVLFLRSRRRSSSRWFFAVALVLGVAPLVLLRAYGQLQQPIGFAGLSYAVFRSVDLLVNIQDGKIQSLGAMEFFAYIFFFPTVSSGPIDRFTRFKADLATQRTREMFWNDANAAVHKILTGFCYKYIIAVLIEKYGLATMPGATGLWRNWLYLYAYSLYLFFDFAGYSAFAIGVSYLLGIHTPENFKQPFLAKNIRDFWTRWHISLSTWFRDHIYMRFVMAMMKSGRLKNARLISALGLLLSFGLMGIWHGTAWHYIGYGFYHAGLMIGYEQWAAFKKRRKWTRSHWWSDALSVVLTFHSVCLGFVIFAGGFPNAVYATHPPTQARPVIKSSP